MTWLWRTFFSALAAAPLIAGSVSGSVQLVQSREASVRKHRDYSGVVVWLEPLAGGAPALLPRHVEMAQKDKKFTPHVLAIPVGSTVDFPNFDPIFHNAFSNFSGQPFDVGLYAPKTSRGVQFRREGIVRVFCNIHPTMSAIIAVLRTPWYAVTLADGTFQIDGAPDGEYRLHVFHERAVESALAALDRRITVKRATTIPPIVISESGYLQTAHKNKYGKDYPPVIQDVPAYGTPK